jgi:hypothetical protein
MLRQAEKVFSTGAAILSGSATGAAIGAALTIHIDKVTWHGPGTRATTTTHNLFGGTPLTADAAIIVSLCAMVILSLVAVALRDLIAARENRRRPAGTPLQP